MIRTHTTFFVYVCTCPLDGCFISSLLWSRYSVIPCAAALGWGMCWVRCCWCRDVHQRAKLAEYNTPLAVLCSVLLTVTIINVCTDAAGTCAHDLVVVSTFIVLMCACVRTAVERCKIRKESESREGLYAEQEERKVKSCKDRAKGDERQGEFYEEGWGSGRLEGG